MPAQTSGSIIAAYAVGDTAPPLERQLLDGAEQPIDLTGATVTITIAPQRHSFFYSPVEPIVSGSPCVVDPDQVNNMGWVSWSPPAGALGPAGSYQFNFEVTYQDGTVQTIPPNSYLPMVISSKPGGVT